jgi:hypothetical protein
MFHGPLALGEAARRDVFNELQGAEPTAVRIFEQPVSLIGHVLMIGGNAEVGIDSHRSIQCPGKRD